MKAVKAFIRSQKTETVLTALKASGITDFTVIDVMGVGKHLTDPEKAKYSVAVVEKYSKITKLEVVCLDEKVEEVLDTIQKNAYTGLKGDGVIYVLPVEEVVKIRNAKKGADALV